MPETIEEKVKVAQVNYLLDNGWRFCRNSFRWWHERLPPEFNMPTLEGALRIQTNWAD